MNFPNIISILNFELKKYQLFYKTYLSIIRLYHASNDACKCFASFNFITLSYSY